jgi:hypothetical protein
VASHRLRLTPSADTAVGDLRGRPAADWSRLEPELKAQGCRAAGYRLLAADGTWSSSCCKHLYGQWRVISSFEPGIVWVIAVAEHDGPEFYKRLSDELGIAGVGRGREQKPACCGEAGWPTIGTTRAGRAITSVSQPAEALRASVGAAEHRLMTQAVSP